MSSLLRICREQGKLNRETMGPCWICFNEFKSLILTPLLKYNIFDPTFFLWGISFSLSFDMFQSVFLSVYSLHTTPPIENNPLFDKGKRDFCFLTHKKYIYCVYISI